MEKRRFTSHTIYTIFLLLTLVFGVKTYNTKQVLSEEIVASSSVPQLVESWQIGLVSFATAQAAELEDKQIIELEWDSLIPADWRPDKIMADYNADNLSDDDPRAKELLEKLKTFWREAPVVKDLDGKQVKLPGFVVPLEMDTKTIGEFLLVPYYGACIHVPPPPKNQIVHVITEPTNPYIGTLFDTVWVTGTIKVKPLSSELAEAGYRIDATKVEPYE